MENNNKLLADFLGHDKKGNDVTWTSPPYLNGKIWVDEHFFDGSEEYNGRRQTEISELKFHKDWNWLMKVVEKIFSEECIKPLAGNGMYYLLELNIEEALKKAKIQAVYNACLEFIKWYNVNK